MNKKRNITFRACPLTEAPALRHFLWSMCEEFHFTQRSIVEEIVQLLFDKGGAVVGYVDGAEASPMAGVFGYFLSEPTRDYANQEIGFIYIAGIAKEYRHMGAFRNGVHFLAQPCTESKTLARPVRWHRRR